VLTEGKLAIQHLYLACFKYS